ncbi:Mannan endo-1,6-alpha-mannosidase DCW1 [Paramyrothecium foliicola]|nr:Mannan endo-1,6-alpha-mannosidase DCW1 [Paramyrothecium foliicola]
MKGLFPAAAAALGLFSQVAQSQGIPLTIGDEASTKEAAATIAFGLMKFYFGNNTGDTPGNLPDPYYWWEAGAMFGTMVDYWLMTGDESYVDVTRQALVHQMSPTKDFMPENQTRTMGNDDQGFWAMAAMSAAENVFPDPAEGETGYLAAAQGAFNDYVDRWNRETECGGGLRWQVFSFNNGYDYKNTISNGCFFNVASRLARFTGNDTYNEWANKIWDWQVSMKLITDGGEVKDGVHIRDGSCSDMDIIEWSYNSGIYLHGAANMYNITEGSEQEQWKTRVDSILKKGLELFTKDGIIFEQLCEPFKTCNTDQQSFKGYYLRWLSATAKLAPDTRDTIYPVIESAAEAAAASCQGSAAAETPPFRGHPGTACGFEWWPKGTHDELHGVGEQMNALSAVMYTLSDAAPAPRTEKTGATSKPDYNAGSSDHDRLELTKKITMGDKVGAGFLTTLMCAGVIGGTSFMII